MGPQRCIGEHRPMETFQSTFQIGRRISGFGAAGQRTKVLSERQSFESAGGEHEQGAKHLAVPGPSLLSVPGRLPLRTRPSRSSAYWARPR